MSVNKVNRSCCEINTKHEVYPEFQDFFGGGKSKFIINLFLMNIISTILLLMVILIFFRDEHVRNHQHICVLF